MPFSRTIITSSFGERLVRVANLRGKIGNRRHAVGERPTRTVYSVIIAAPRRCRGRISVNATLGLPTGRVVYRLPGLSRRHSGHATVENIAITRTRHDTGTPVHGSGFVFRYCWSHTRQCVHQLRDVSP